MRHLLPLLLLSACADKDWKAAVQADATESWLAYAQAHPGTGHADAALRHAEQLSWDQAVAAGTSVAYESFRATWPTSPRAAEAATKAESLAWDEALSDGGAGAWTTYLARYPDSPRKAEAEQHLEDAVFEAARRENTEQSWGRYLLRYPQGRHAQEAATVRELLGWQAAVAADTPAAYREFLRRYEGGEHTAAAQTWLDATLVSTLQPVVVLHGSWQADRLRPTLLKRYQQELDKDLVPALKREFTVLPTKTVDVAKTPMNHPQDLFPPSPGAGLLVLDVTERQGRAFDPDGYATDIDAHVQLYTPGTRTPVVDLPVRGSTPAKIHGIDESALHTSAVADLGGQLPATADAVVAFKRPVPR